MKQALAVADIYATGQWGVYWLEEGMGNLWLEWLKKLL